MMDSCVSVSVESVTLAEIASRRGVFNQSKATGDVGPETRPIWENVCSLLEEDEERSMNSGCRGVTLAEELERSFEWEELLAVVLFLCKRRRLFVYRDFLYLPVWFDTRWCETRSKEVWLASPCLVLKLLWKWGIVLVSTMGWCRWGECTGGILDISISDWVLT